MTTNTYFFLHYTGKVYRKDMSVDDAIRASWPKGLSMQLVAQSNLVVVLNPSGTGKILKDREYRTEDLTQKEMVLLSLKAVPV